MCPLVLSLLFWPGSGEAGAMAAPASLPRSFSLLLLVALGQEPHFPLCSPSNARQVGHGQRGCEKGGRLKVTLLFPSAEQSEGCDTLSQQDLYLLL